MRKIYIERRKHKHPDWQVFCDWIETLPYFNILIMPEINKDTVELKKNTIEIKILIDKPSQMAKITCDGKCIMEGNFWDFYSGCHGIIEWGDFNSMEELIENIAKKYKNDGYIVSIIRESYKYE